MLESRKLVTDQRFYSQFLGKKMIKMVFLTRSTTAPATKHLAIALALAVTACAAPQHTSNDMAIAKSTRQTWDAAVMRWGQIPCNTKKDCDAIYRYAEDKITEHSDMKVQTFTSTTLETYSPRNSRQVGMSLTRKLIKGDEEQISLRIVCVGLLTEASWPNDATACYRRTALIYQEYGEKLTAAGLAPK